MQSELIQALLAQRTALIQALEVGELTKSEFLTRLHDVYLECGYRPAKEVKSVEQGIIDYQYYNTMAKYHLMLGSDCEFNDPRAFKRHKDQALDYYGKKDLVTMALVALKAYQNMEAYYLEMHSQALEGSLFEIVFKDEAYVVLHSKDKRLQYRLNEQGVFLEGPRPSIIETYVNKRY